MTDLKKGLKPRKKHLVWCENRGLPTVAHPTIGIAEREAKRLAALNPGEDFHVMSTVATHRVPKEEK